MKIISIVFLLFISVHLYGQDYYIINAENGLNVREKGNLTSKKIAKLRHGFLVEVIEETDEIFTITDNGKQIKGRFLKIKAYSEEYIEGYVFDAYLIKQVDKEALNINQIDRTLYLELSKKALNKKP